MLLPFILFQIAIGKAEDKYHNEKDVLMAGFLILSVATILIGFLNDKNIVIWAAILFTTRIGACLIEISSESFFFKHIKSENAPFMSFFRLSRSIPYLFSPIIAGLVIAFLGYQSLFILLGITMLLGLRYTFYISPDKKL
jgi:MFS family permease